MNDTEEIPDSQDIDIIDEFDNTPEGELGHAKSEENLGNEDFDYQQGFNQNIGSSHDGGKDSITRFYRDIIDLLIPKKVVRVANFRPKEVKNAKLFLNMADYNRMENNPLIARYFENLAVNEAATSMGRGGFIVQNIMTQRRIVQRQTEKPNPQAQNYTSKAGGGRK